MVYVKRKNKERKFIKNLICESCGHKWTMSTKGQMGGNLLPFHVNCGKCKSKNVRFNDAPVIVKQEIKKPVNHHNPSLLSKNKDNFIKSFFKRFFKKLIRKIFSK